MAAISDARGGRAAAPLPARSSCRRPPDDPVGTTSWRLTDRRAPGDVQRAPASSAQVGSAGLVSARRRPPRQVLRRISREGLRRSARRFATLFGARKRRSTSSRGVRTHAELDAPRWLPAAKFRAPRLPTATPAFRARTPRCSKISPATATPCSASSIRTKRPRATLADGRVVTLLDEAGKLLPGDPRRLRRVGPRGRDDGRGDAHGGRRRAAPAAARISRQGSARPTCALRRWVDDTRLVLDRLVEPPVRRAWPVGSPRGSTSRRRWCLRPFDGRRHRRASSASKIAAAGRGLNLDGIPQYGDDDRQVDAASVPDGLLGAARTTRRERRDLSARGAPVLPGRRARHPAPRLQRHGVLGRAAPRAARARPDRSRARASEITSAIVRGSTSTRSYWAGARRCWPGRRRFREVDGPDQCRRPAVRATQRQMTSRPACRV